MSDEAIGIEEAKGQDMLKVTGATQADANRIQELQDKLAGLTDGIAPTFVHPSCKRTGQMQANGQKLGYTYHKYPVIDAGGTFEVQVDGTAEAIAGDAAGARRLSAAERAELAGLIAGAVGP